MLLDDGCEVDYQWWGEGGDELDEADDETWSEDDTEAIDGLDSGSDSDAEDSAINAGYGYGSASELAHERRQKRERGNGVDGYASATRQPHWVQAPAPVLSSGATGGIVQEALPVQQLAPALPAWQAVHNVEQTRTDADTIDTTTVIEIVIES